MTNRILLILGAILIISIFVVILIARSPYIHTKLTSIVLHELKQKAGIDLKSDSIDLALFPPAIEIDGGSVTILSIAKVDFNRAFVKISTLRLLGGEFSVQNLQIRNPRIEILVESKGPNIKPGSKISVNAPREIFQQVLNLPVQNIELIDGTLVWDSKEIKSDLSRIKITNRKNKLNLNIEIGKSSLKFKGKNIEVSELLLFGNLQENKLNIRNAQISGSLGSLTINGMLWGGLFDGSEQLLKSEMDFSIKTALNLSSISQVFSTPEPTSGNLLANGTLTKTLKAPQFEGEVNSSNLVYSSIKLPKLVASIKANQKLIEVKPLKLFYQNNELKITGKITPYASWAAEALVELESVPLRDVLKSLAVETDPARAAISGAINVTGSFEPVDFKYKATLSLKDFGAGSGEDIVYFSEGIVETEGKINNKIILFDKSQVLVKDGGTISTTGKIDYDGPVRFDFFTDQFQLASLGRISQLPIMGVTSIVGSVTDAPNEATVLQGTIRAEEFSIANTNLGWLSGAFVYAKDFITISDTTIRQGESEYFANAKINTSTGVFSNTNFSFSKLRYQDLMETLLSHIDFPPWIEGDLKGNLTLEGPLTLDDISGTIDVDMLETKIAGEEFQAVKLLGRVTKGNLTVQNATLKKENGNFVVSGSTKLGKELNLKLVGQGAKYKDLSIIKKHKVPLDGHLEIEANLSGKWDSPIGDGLIKVSNVSLGGEPLPASVIKLEMKNKLFGVGWFLENKELTLKSIIRLSDPYPFDLEIFADGYHFDPFLALVVSPGQNFEGQLQGTVNLNGTLSPLFIKTGKAELPSLTIKRGNLVFQNRDKLDLKIKDGNLNITPFHLIGPRTDIILSGTISPDSDLGLQLNGTFDLSLVEFFVPSLSRTSGIGKIDSRVGGKIKQPELIGNISLQQVAFQTKWLSQPIEQLNAKISFTQRLISLEQANGFCGGGPVTAYGTISLPPEEPPQFSLHLSSTNNRILIARNLNSRLSSNLHLTGNDRPYLLNGEVVFDDIIYREKINWQANLFKRKSMVGPKVIKEELPLVAFDVDFDLQKGFLIDNNLAKIALQGKLKLIGNTYRPNIQGKLQLVKGETFFQDNEFKMTSGEVTFNDPIEINPYFDLHAESKVRDYLVSVALVGYLGDYELQLASQPPLSEGDIATLLTLGVTTQEVAGKEGAFAAAELGSLLFGGVSTALDTDNKYFGLKFRVTPSYSTTKKATVPKVIVGSQITKDLEASFATTIGESIFFEDREARVEYRFNDNLSLQGTWEDPEQSQTLNDDTKLGVDLRYIFEFK